MVPVPRACPDCFPRQHLSQPWLLSSSPTVPLPLPLQTSKAISVQGCIPPHHSLLPPPPACGTRKLSVVALVPPCLLSLSVFPPLRGLRAHLALPQVEAVKRAVAMEQKGNALWAVSGGYGELEGAYAWTWAASF